MSQTYFTKVLCGLQLAGTRRLQAKKQEGIEHSEKCRITPTRRAEAVAAEETVVSEVDVEVFEEEIRLVDNT